MCWTKRIDKLPAFIDVDGVVYELDIIVKPYYMSISYVSLVDDTDILIRNSITKHSEPFDGDIYNHLDTFAYDTLKMIKNKAWKNKTE